MSQTAAVENAIVPANDSVVALTPMDVISRAVSEGRDVAVIEKLMDLQERWEKNQARKAFDEAIAAARLEIKPIVKNRHVGFESRKAGAARTDYKHEDLAEIARTVDPVLGKHGLSYRWRTAATPNEPVSVTCIVSHRFGHSEENTLAAGRDDTGNKNSIQQIGSTITYLQRYTLKAALGLAASNDDDGVASETQERSVIDATQAQAIRDALAKVGMSEYRFLKWAKVEKIEDIEADVYDSCITAIARAGANKQKAAANV